MHNIMKILIMIKMIHYHHHHQTTNDTNENQAITTAPPPVFKTEMLDWLRSDFDDFDLGPAPTNLQVIVLHVV